jgi:hypothetical protein
MSRKLLWVLLLSPAVLAPSVVLAQLDPNAHGQCTKIFQQENNARTGPQADKFFKGQDKHTAQEELVAQCENPDTSVSMFPG